MPTRVLFAPEFERGLTRLSRKYPSVIREIDRLVTQLQTDERPGDKIPGVGYDVYKMRLKNPAASRGKRGGFRVIYYVQVADLIYLIAIYSKTEQTDIPAETIRRLIASLE
jgi:mRNA-degrading endonuclease RelE of RelBE toxin-antitoxin system